jgi:hypothetical protein
MPLELGIFLGCSHFGTAEHKAKACLIMDRMNFVTANLSRISRVKTLWRTIIHQRKQFMK